MKENEKPFIATWEWREPKKKLPLDGKPCLITFSKGLRYHHAIAIAKCYHPWAIDEFPIWLIDGLTAKESVTCHIEKWCDLKLVHRGDYCDKFEEKRKQDG